MPFLESPLSQDWGLFSLVHRFPTFLDVDSPFAWIVEIAPFNPL